MTQKLFSLIAGIVFAVVALVHLWRYAQHIPITFGDTAIPLSWSIPGFIIPAILAFYGLRFGTQRP